MTAPRPAVPSPLPPTTLPPESAAEKLRNAQLILKANTRVTLESSFQPVGAYDRAMTLLADAIDQLDQERA